MTLKNFFIGRAIGLIVLLVIVAIIGGFYALNSYIYKEKQENGAPSGSTQVVSKSSLATFSWKYEKAKTLNPDGNPNTDIFLEATYENGTVENKLIDTTPGSCNDLPDADKDSTPNTTNIQCYSAGLGYRFKIVNGTDSYVVMRKTFEEASPEYNPAPTEYEVVSEFPLSI